MVPLFKVQNQWYPLRGVVVGGLIPGCSLQMTIFRLQPPKMSFPAYGIL